VEIRSKLIAERIRWLRYERGLRLEDVAKRAGYTKGFLSKIERGRTSPPIATLMRIGTALGVDPGELLNETEGETETDLQASVHVKPETRLDVHNSDAGPGYSYMALAAPRRHKLMEPFYLTVTPEDVHPNKRFQHPGEEFIFVLEGRGDYLVGEETFALEKGDSLYFDATRPHAPIPKGGPMTFLAIFCAPKRPLPRAKAPRAARKRLKPST
jgi:transcriptional regulator with XRE-family HTH domain